jgi:hypothetical protein
VRNTTFMTAGAFRTGGGRLAVCSTKKYNSVPVLLSTPPCFTSFATPTTVYHGT